MKHLFLLISAVCISLTSLASDDKVAQEIKRIELSAEIARMVGDDQAFRFGGTVALKKGIPWDEISRHPLYKKHLAKIDPQNAKRIKVIIKKNGWPKISDYGEYTARNTWLLIQHMDQDVAFQEQILEQMKSLLASNEVIKTDYALLFDRVLVNTGKLQRYGSQGGCVGKQWEPKPIEDAAQVDQRRAEMGLPTMEEYKKMFKDICI